MGKLKEIIPKKTLPPSDSSPKVQEKSSEAKPRFRGLLGTLEVMLLTGASLQLKPRHILGEKRTGRVNNLPFVGSAMAKKEWEMARNKKLKTQEVEHK